MRVRARTFVFADYQSVLVGSITPISLRYITASNCMVIVWLLYGYCVVRAEKKYFGKPLFLCWIANAPCVFFQSNTKNPELTLIDILIDANCLKQNPYQLVYSF